MIKGLGNPEPSIANGSALGKRAEFSMARGEIRRGEHGGDQLTETLVALHPVEGRHSAQETADRLTILAPSLIGEAEVQVSQQVRDDLATGPAERECWAAAMA